MAHNLTDRRRGLGGGQPPVNCNYVHLWFDSTDRAGFLRRAARPAGSPAATSRGPARRRLDAPPRHGHNKLRVGSSVPITSKDRARLPRVRGRRAGREVTMAMAMLGNGVYTLTEAARLTGLRPRRVREWFRGRTATAAPPAFPGDYRPVSGQMAISFHDLVEVFIAGQLRDKGSPPSSSAASTPG